ncbi:STAS domain-containing protein [Paraburkholderia sacchari]|uniref:STAS domain-containing protein n=1 Tax=Paraburkholderia sacchari TaxID=159450 RepID=UPI002467CB36|nr:STAS domain-containing protein [Paraburkholderia sacchari]
MANQYETHGDVLVANLEGALNSTNSAQVEAEILRRLDLGTNQLLIDLGALDYISSAGLRVVLVAAKRLRQSAGLLVLCGVRNQIREAFEISGFLNILSVADTRAQALERLNQVA